jgi:hypothetical protein
MKYGPPDHLTGRISLRAIRKTGQRGARTITT